MAASGAVLVGGESRRMGADKALLSFRGRRMIEWVVEALSGVVDEVLLVGRGADRLAWLGLPTMEDRLPGGGPLAGIYTALAAARYSHCLIVACDMPFLDPALLAYLLAQAPGWDAVVPQVQDHLEPLHAVYARSCLPVIRDMLAAGELCPLDLYPRVRVRYVEEEEIAAFRNGPWSFVNFNTPEDLRALGEPEPIAPGPLPLPILLKGVDLCW
ncbi:MAG: molybdenum cofactor guanylyltransferase [Anaerolineae bacterium]